MVRTLAETLMQCWKCGDGLADPAGFCRCCGADTRFRPRQPTEAETERGTKYYEVRAPTYSRISKNIAAYERMERRGMVDPD